MVPVFVAKQECPSRCRKLNLRHLRWRETLWTRSCGANFTTQDNELCTECKKSAFSPLSHRALSARGGHCFVGLKLARSHREQRVALRHQSSHQPPQLELPTPLSTPTHSGRSVHGCFAADARRAYTTADSEQRLCILSSCSRLLVAVIKNTDLTAVRVPSSNLTFGLPLYMLTLFM